jgi:hypothetical protein
MTSFRQIEANRRNALRSTGPTTEDGERQSRRALHHGLTAETVIDGLGGQQKFSRVRGCGHRGLRRAHRRRAGTRAAAWSGACGGLSRNLLGPNPRLCYSHFKNISSAGTTRAARPCSKR